MKLKYFRGIKFVPFRLVLNPSDGFGFSLLELYITFRPPNTATIQNGWALFAFNYMKHRTGNGGWKNRIWISIFGFGKEFVLKQLIVLDASEFEEDDYDS